MMFGVKGTRIMRWVNPCACLLFVVIGGCGAPQVQKDAPTNPTAQPIDCPVRVYALRGLWDIFSTGLDDLAVELRDAGAEAAALSGPDWPKLGDEIEQAVAKGETTGAIVLIGHSFGVDQAIQLCDRLNKSGISVPLLLLLDGTNPGPVPSNVDRCVHYYLPNSLGDSFPSSFSGNPVVAAEGNEHTQIENVVLSVENFGPEVGDTNHFIMESNPRMHSIIIEEITRLCSTPAEKADAAGP